MSSLRRLALGALGLITLIPAACRAGEATCPSSRFFRLNGAIASDNRSGLEWQRCALGRTWTGKDCGGEAILLSQADATKAAAQTRKGWRLPTAQEIADILDDDCPGGKTPGDVFPDLDHDNPEGDPYWTQTPVGMAGLWYFADLINGDIDGHSPGFGLHVRLVRKP